MKVKPYFRTTLAKPYQGKYYHEAGTSVVMNAEVDTKSIGKFLIMLPDPVSLNLNNAQNAIDRAETILERINKSKKITVFSKILTEEKIQELTKDQILKLDPNANVLRNLNDEKIFEYMQLSMGIVISLITSVESFLNLIIPHDYTVKKSNKVGDDVTLDKLHIVRRFSIEDKIELVGAIKKRENVKQEKFWSSFKVVKNLRDEIIHFKKMDSKIDQMWTPILVSFFDSDFQVFFDDTVKLINYLEPEYLEYED